MEHIIGLDFWGTLAKGNPAFKKVKIQILRKSFTLNHTDAEIEEAQQQVKDHFNDIIEKWGIQPSLPTLFASWLHGLSIPVENVPLNTLGQFIRRYQEAAKDFPALPFDDHTEETIARLAQQHRLVLVSNTLFVAGSTIRHWLEKIGWLQYFSQLIFSDEAGISKPDPAIFQQSAHGITTHIGDNPKTDGGGALRASIPFIGINGNYQHNIKHVFTLLPNG